MIRSHCRCRRNVVALQLYSSFSPIPHRNDSGKSLQMRETSRAATTQKTPMNRTLEPHHRLFSAILWHPKVKVSFLWSYAPRSRPFSFFITLMHKWISFSHCLASRCVRAFRLVLLLLPRLLLLIFPFNGRKINGRCVSDNIQPYKYNIINFLFIYTNAERRFFPPFLLLFYSRCFRCALNTSDAVHTVEVSIRNGVDSMNPFQIQYFPICWKPGEDVKKRKQQRKEHACMKCVRGAAFFPCT